MSPETSVTALSALRIVVGVLAFFTPGLASTLFGLDAKRNRQGPYMSRLFGIRDIAMGIGTLASRGEARRLWLKLGIVCDAGDAAAAAIGGRDGYLPQTTAVMVGAPAVTAIGLGALALQAEDSPLP